MYSAVTSLPRPERLVAQLPFAGTALVATEFLYKPHGFTLELCLLLAAWCVLSGLSQSVRATGRS